MPSPRPGSVTAAAILAIIYGTLFTICGLCGLFGLAAQGTKGFMGGGDPQQAKMQEQIEAAMVRDVPGYRVTTIVMPIVGLVLALAILIAGIGLLGMHRWARTLALIAVLFAMATTGFQVIYQSVFVLPAMNDAMAEALPAAMPKGPGPGPDIAKIMQVTMSVAAVIGMIISVCVIIYLAIIVLLLLRSHVRAAFAGEWQPADARELLRQAEADDAWERPRPPPPNPDDQGLYR